MQVYDLDKTQEWLNRTLAIRREPPVRGGVRTDLKARRQTLAGLGVVAAVVGSLALWPKGAPVSAVAPATVPPAVASPVAPGSQTVFAPLTQQTSPVSANAWPGSVSQSTDRPLLDIMQQPTGTRRSGTPWDGHVAPPAPTWLDGQ